MSRCHAVKVRLQASVKQHGWLTEAQLRAAASVASKRADDEAMYATKKVEELQQKLGSSVQVQLMHYSTAWANHTMYHLQCGNVLALSKV